MRISLLVLGATLALGGTASQAAACNSRGEFCSYPGWAANAFSGPEDRVPDYWRNDPVGAFGYVGSVGYGYAPGYGYTAGYGYAPGYGYRAGYGYAPSYGYVGARYYREERDLRRDRW